MSSRSPEKKKKEILDLKGSFACPSCKKKISLPKELAAMAEKEKTYALIFQFRCEKCKNFVSIDGNSFS